MQAQTAARYEDVLAHDVTFTGTGVKTKTEARTHTCAEGAARRLSERGRGAMFCIELVSMVASSNDVEVHMINE